MALFWWTMVYYGQIRWTVVNYGLILVTYGSCSSRNRLDQFRLCASVKSKSNWGADHWSSQRWSCTSLGCEAISSFDMFRLGKEPPRDLWVTDEIWVTMVTDVCHWKATSSTNLRPGACHTQDLVEVRPLVQRHLWIQRRGHRFERRDATRPTKRTTAAGHGVALLIYHSKPSPPFGTHTT